MTTKFSGEPQTQWTTEAGGDRNMQVIDDFSFTDRSGREWMAKAGSVVNGASIPKALWSILGSPYIGDYRRATIIHDVGCEEARGWRERRRVDRVFYQGCRAGGCSIRDSIVLYVGVRIGAWWRYKGLLEQESLRPQLVEADSEKALRSLFVSVAEEVLSAGEVDDDEILEARVDKIESKIEEKAITIPGLAQMIEDENIAANKFFEEEDTGILIVEEDDHQVSVALSEIPLAAEQYYRVTENKSPCGEEDRLPCDDSSEFPHSAICYLIMRKSFGRESRGTGFFISPDTIVTAGHCLRSGWGRVRSIEVIPGRMGADMPFGSAFAKRWFVPQQWSRGGDVRFDYGAIKMSDASLGEQTGYLPIDVLSDDEILQKMITTSGYPSDMPISTNQHFNSGECDDVQEQRLVYSLDTWKGASGSPVWVELDGKRVVIGIHNYGHCPNRATRVNRRVFEDLERWVKS